MSHQRNFKLSSRLSRKNRFIDILNAGKQKGKQTRKPVTSIAEGLSQVLSDGLEGYAGYKDRQDEEADDLDMALVAKAFEKGTGRQAFEPDDDKYATTSPDGTVTGTPITSEPIAIDEITAKYNPVMGAPVMDTHATGVDNNFLTSLNKMIGDAPEGVNIKLLSGFRTIKRQGELFDAAIKKYGSKAAARKYVAPPGKSQHNKGLAYDLKYGNHASRDYAHKNAGDYGLKFPMSYEPWHIETKDARTRGALAAAPQQQTTIPTGRPTIPMGTQDRVISDFEQPADALGGQSDPVDPAQFNAAPHQPLQPFEQTQPYVAQPQPRPEQLQPFEQTQPYAAPQQPLQPQAPQPAESIYGGYQGGIDALRDPSFADNKYAQETIQHYTALLADQRREAAALQNQRDYNAGLLTAAQKRQDDLLTGARDYKERLLQEARDRTLSEPIKGADGYWYNPVTQERTLPNVVAPPPEASSAALPKPIKGADGYWYNKDGTRTLPDVVKPDEYSSRKDRFGNTIIFNKETGERVEQPLPGGVKTPPLPGGVNEGSGSPIDISSATGLYGMTANAINKFTDAIGGGFAAPDNAHATATLNILNFEARDALSDDFSGRPSVYLQKIISELIPAPNSFFTGEATAIGKMKAIRDHVARKIYKNNNTLKSGKITAAMASKVFINQENLKTIYSQYNMIIPLGSQATPDDGMNDAELESLSNIYEK